MATTGRSTGSEAGASAEPLSAMFRLFVPCGLGEDCMPSPSHEPPASPLPAPEPVRRKPAAGVVSAQGALFSPPPGHRQPEVTPRTKARAALSVDKVRTAALQEAEAEYEGAVKERVAHAAALSSDVWATIRSEEAAEARVAQLSAAQRRSEEAAWPNERTTDEMAAAQGLAVARQAAEAVAKAAEASQAAAAALQRKQAAADEARQARLALRARHHAAESEAKEKGEAKEKAIEKEKERLHALAREESVAMEERMAKEAMRKTEALASARAMLEVKEKYEQAEAVRRKMETTVAIPVAAPGPLGAAGAANPKGLATLKAAVAAERAGKALSKAQKKRAQKKRAALRKLEEAKGGDQEELGPLMKS